MKKALAVLGLVLFTGVMAGQEQAGHGIANLHDEAASSSINFTPYRVLSGTCSPSTLCDSNWSDKIVVSNTTGTHTDSAPLLPSDTLYVDWAVSNNGTDSALVTVFTDLYVDGVLKQTWQSYPPWLSNWWVGVQDYSIGSLPAGTHTVRIVADSTNAVAESNESDNEYTKTFTVGSPPGGCTANSTTLCLSSARFKVQVAWQSPTASGSGTAVGMTSGTGYFWFFDNTNVELIVKVLDGTTTNGRFWVFAAGMTNVHTVLTVTDTQTGAVRVYTNLQGVAFQPVQDTLAFTP